jgi:Uma2 family endonuclease
LLFEEEILSLGDLRLWIPNHRLYTYPDVFVIQGEPVFQAQRRDTILNPCLIIEVLSKSTKDYDRTDKFRYYRSIAEFREYLLVDQYERVVEYYTKLDDRSWLYRSYESDVETITVASVELEIAIEDIYEGIEFK